jgi:hypothetical protein
MAELKTFVFAITFIIVFAGLLGSIPTDLQGQGNIADVPTPLDPALIAGFESYTNYSMASLSAYNQYEYDFSSRSWFFEYYSGNQEIVLGAKIIYAGFLWLGGLDSCEFISVSGNNRGASVSPSEIMEDADNGTARYSLQYLVNGASAGGFVIYWNTTLYTDIADAYTADAVYFVHGVGVSTSANMDIVSLLISLLLLQLPDCPTLVNLLLATPLYACVIYLIWYIIKETLPFV